MAEFKMTVGLEVHIELKTNTKIFCSCRTDFGAPPNTLICPVCMGLPGSLPRLNRRVVEYAVRAGLATNCKIAHSSHTDRKNYFYPDLPKAFQISQYDEPLCYDGGIEISVDGNTKTVGITRIHIEEDAGKLLHLPDGSTLIDYNRCGVPLIEIVSEPQIHSAKEAKAYLKELRTRLLYASISDCKMNEGSMRCDVNISVAPADSDTLGTRTEIKNINSFNFAAKAIDAEFARQTALILSGGRVECETRRYNEQSGKTERMRKKESSADYRFFREPDLLPFKLTDDDIESIRAKLPEMPDVRRKHYTKAFDLSEHDAALLTSDIALAELFEAAARCTKHKKLLANLLLGEALRLCNSEDFSSPLPPEYFAELAELWGDEEINSSSAKKLLTRLWSDSELAYLSSPKELVDSENLRQINDRKAIEALALTAFEKNARSLADYKAGKKNALRALVGTVMSASDGRANPKLAEEVVKELAEK